MATLVQFLAAGVNGAANGTATFLQRGTASSAASSLYNDFERTAQPGTNVITLDANGAAEVYCSTYVDVAIRNSAGTLLRTVTVGNSSSVVEVRSTSFRGDDYDGNPSNTVEQPVTLTAVLNRWISSAGAADFQVLIDGVATNLQTAFAGFSGIFVNVKDPQYGAVGDGVTSDTTAIANAIAEANSIGAVVIFPPGTYLCGQVTIAAANFCLLGFGQATIRGTSSGGSIFVPTDTNPGVRIISGIKFEGNGSPARALDFTAPMTVMIDSCTFDEDGFTTGLIRFRDGGGIFYLTRCQFVAVAAASGNPLQHTSGDDKRVIISDCHFSLGLGFTNAAISGSCFSVSNCVFDGSEVTVGTYYMIDPHHPTDADVAAGNVSNCSFIDGGSSGFVFDLTSLGDDCNFSESGNTFAGFAVPTLSGDSGNIYDIAGSSSDVFGTIALGSRLGRTVYVDNAAATFSADMCLEAENVVIAHSGSAGCDITIPALIPGLKGQVTLWVDAALPAQTFEFLGSGGEGITPGNIGANQAVTALYVTLSRDDGVLHSFVVAAQEATL